MDDFDWNEARACTGTDCEECRDDGVFLALAQIGSPAGEPSGEISSLGGDTFVVGVETKEREEDITKISADIEEKVAETETFEETIYYYPAENPVSSCAVVSSPSSCVSISSSPETWQRTALAS